MRIDKSPRGPVTSFLRRRAALSALADIGWRVVLVIALMGIVLLVHWFERDSLYDGVDGEISFIAILYFTTVTITSSAEHTSELQSLMSISYAVFRLNTQIMTHQL